MTIECETQLRIRGIHQDLIVFGMTTRYAGLEALFGEKGSKNIRNSKVLLVGAGGIGSEMLKELVVVGVGEIHLVDLDTIDLSNLNRQFLFSQRHVKQPKAKVAAEVAAEFNLNVHIVPYHANIMDAQFSPKWFQSFDLVFNALDNADARRHVNKMCVATKRPLIDAGTAGFNGQTQVILPGETECYDCFSHPTPVSFPVCTIRSTPTQPIHSVVWAKSYLFNLLFGRDEDAETGPDVDNTVTEENQDEINRLKKEQSELSVLKASLDEPEFILKLVDKVFVGDINRLLSMDTMWKGRRKPVPLELPSEFSSTVEPEVAPEGEDQIVWSVLQDIQVLQSSSKSLAIRSKEAELSFDKDDEDALNFVTAASNLRSHIFGLQEKSKFDVKEIAGNIIPAIATTNAIVSGLGVVEALKILAEKRDILRNVNIWRGSDLVLRSERPVAPNKNCQVCSSARTTLKGDTKDLSLEDLVEKFLKVSLGYSDVSIVTDRLLYDPDYEDNLSKSLADLGLFDTFITVIDEDDRLVNLDVYISEPTEGTVEIEQVSIPLRPSKEKRKAEDTDNELEEVEDLAPATKRGKFDSDIIEILDDNAVVINENDIDLRD